MFECRLSLLVQKFAYSIKGHILIGKLKQSLASIMSAIPITHGRHTHMTHSNLQLLYY
jgi:hypothetical protein